MKYGVELQKLGHDVYFFNLKEKWAFDVPDDTDIVWLQNTNYIDKFKLPLKKIQKSGAKLVVYSSISVGKTILEMKEILKPFDYVFLGSKYFAEKLGTHYMPLGFYKEDYYPKVSNRTVDISFAGHPQTAVEIEKDMRVYYLKRLPQVEVHGKRLCKRLGIKVRAFHDHQYQRELYNRTKVNLGLPFINGPHYHDMFHLKNRFFEIPACRSLLLTAYTDEFAELFEPDKEIFYYKSITELKEKAEELVKNSDKYEGVREVAYQRALREHQYSHRFKKMMDVINE